MIPYAIRYFPECTVGKISICNKLHIDKEVSLFFYFFVAFVQFPSNFSITSQAALIMLIITLQ